jgi:hypothetical protein
MSETLKDRIKLSLNSEHIPVDNSIVIENMRKLREAKEKDYLKRRLEQIVKARQSNIPKILQRLTILEEPDDISDILSTPPASPDDNIQIPDINIEEPKHEILDEQTEKCKKAIELREKIKNLPTTNITIPNNTTFVKNIRMYRRR